MDMIDHLRQIEFPAIGSVGTWYICEFWQRSMDCQSCAVADCVRRGEARSTDDPDDIGFEILLMIVEFLGERGLKK